MPIEDGDAGAAAPQAAPGTAGDPDEDREEDREKVIVRSNGTVTYVGKDIAYQFWKFGLLGRDFHYRPFEQGADDEVGLGHVEPGRCREARCTRRSAAARRSTTSSTSGSRTCRSC